jgi:hypothetical protein
MFKTKSDFNIDNITSIMAVFVWESSRLSNDLDTEQKKYVRSMLNKYQMYVITESGYRRKDQKSRLQKLAKDTIDISISEYKSASQFHKLLENSINNDLRSLYGVKKTNKNMSVIKQPTGVSVMGFDNNKNRVKVKFGMTADDGSSDRVTNREKRLIKKDIQSQIRRELLGKEKENVNQMDRMMLMMEAMQERMKRQDDMMEAMIQQKIENTDTQLDGQDSIQLHKVTKTIANDLRNLTDMAKNNQSFDQVSWKDVPEWLKTSFISGLKRTAVGSAMIPFQAVKGIITEFYVKPVTMVAEFYKGKIQFILGHVHWFFIIGGTIHVYTTSDYESVNEFYNAYGGGIVNKLIVDPAWMVAQQINLWFPNFTSMLESIIDTMWNTIALQLWDAIKALPKWMLDWFVEVVKSTVKETLTEMAPSLPSFW